MFCLTHPNQRVAHSGHELSLCLPSEKPPRDEISLLVFVFAVTQAEDGLRLVGKGGGREGGVGR